MILVHFNISCNIRGTVMLSKNKVKTAVLVLSVVPFLFSGCAFGGNRVFGTKYDSYKKAGQYQVGSFDYSVEGIESIDIDWIAGEVILKETKSSSLKVRENSESLSNSEQVHYLIDGNTLMIKYCESGYIGNIDTKYKNLTVEIPAGISITINSVSADIEAEKLTQNEIKAENVSGSIKIGSLKASDAHIDSVSGNINIENSYAENTLKFYSVSGKISVAKINSPEIDIESVSGDITAEMTNSAKARITTVSASIDLTIPKSSGTEIDFSTTSGKLSTKLDNTNKNNLYTFAAEKPTDDTDVKPSRITVDTVSGDLTVK